MIAVRDERQACDFDPMDPISDRHFEQRIRVCDPSVDIAYGDRVSRRRPEAAGAYSTHLVPGIVQQHHAAAQRDAALRTKADAYARGAGLQLTQNEFGAGKGGDRSWCAVFLRDYPTEACFDRRGAGIDVGSRKAQSRSASPAATEISKPSSPV